MIQNAFTILELETKCIGMHQLHGVAPIIPLLEKQRQSDTSDEFAVLF